MILKDDPKAYAIMGCAMRVHSILGYGFLESAYGDALEIEFKKAGIPYVREDSVRARTPRAGKGAPLTLRLCFALSSPVSQIQMRAIPSALRAGVA